MLTITILAGIIAVATAGIIFLVCEDITASFMAAVLAFLFFFALGGATLTLMPEFAESFILAPAEWVWSKISALAQYFFK